MLIRDILLPFDYPANWIGGHYSEQYSLAAYLLTEYSEINVLLYWRIKADVPVSGSNLVTHGRKQHSEAFSRSLWLTIN